MKYTVEWDLTESNIVVWDENLQAEVQIVFKDKLMSKEDKINLIKLIIEKLS